MRYRGTHTAHTCTRVHPNTPHAPAVSPAPLSAPANSCPPHRPRPASAALPRSPARAWSLSSSRSGCRCPCRAPHLSCPCLWGGGKCCLPLRSHRVLPWGAVGPERGALSLHLTCPLAPGRVRGSRAAGKARGKPGPAGWGSGVSLACVSWSVTLAVNLSRTRPGFPGWTTAGQATSPAWRPQGRSSPPLTLPSVPRLLLLASLMAVLLLEAGSARTLQVRVGSSPSRPRGWACGHWGPQQGLLDKSR